MTNTLLVLLLIGLLVAAILLYPIAVRWRRRKLGQRPFPARWRSLLELRVAPYVQLTAEQRRQLHSYVQVFLAEKQFIGCNGLQVTEEMKLTIAAISSLLLLNGQGDYFPKLRSILVYPTAYWVTETVATDAYVVEERRVARLGESWSRDQVVLAWDQVERDAQDWQDGHNVVLHEFAHQLDQADGTTDGVPCLPASLTASDWSQIMAPVYKQLCQAVERNRPTVLDPYGATHPAEFFAVVTETFFEQPWALQTHYPSLYDLLKRYYQLDPGQWR